MLKWLQTVKFPQLKACKRGAVVEVCVGNQKDAGSIPAHGDLFSQTSISSASFKCI
jgi:hypothetical protein